MVETLDAVELTIANLERLTARILELEGDNESLRLQISRLDDQLDRFRRAAARVRERSEHLAVCKAKAGDAKKAYDGAVVEFIEVDEDEDRPLLKAMEEQPSRKVEAVAAVDDSDTVETEEWRSEPITVLALDDRINQLLLEAKPFAIATLGDLTDFLNNDGRPRQYTDIDGIGPAKAQKIDDALVQWFAQNPDKYRQPVAQTVEDKTEEDAADECLEEDSEDLDEAVYGPEDDEEIADEEEASDEEE